MEYEKDDITKEQLDEFDRIRTVLKHSGADLSKIKLKKKKDSNFDMRKLCDEFDSICEKLRNSGANLNIPIVPKV